MLIQLNPPIPVRVVAHPDWKGPTGKGMAIGWYSPSIEYNLIWIVFMDDTGQSWEVDNSYIRATTNITWGRNEPER
jgi:hypothetical protein